MALMMLGTKLGMTRTYTPEGVSVPVTVIALGPCVVTQVRTKAKDGYTAIQLGYGEAKASRSTIPVIQHDAKAGTTPKRYHREFRVAEGDEAKFAAGQTLTVKDFEGTKYVDVTGTSKGKGFQGVMKRHHFKGMFASHGTERKHRSPGSISSLCSNRGYGGGLKKGKRMPGRMGNERTTCRSLDVIGMDVEKGVMLVKGGVPGAARGMVMIRVATRLYKSKAKKLLAKK